jgi:hypothetical protein
MSFAISASVSNASGLSATASAAINVTQLATGLSVELALAGGKLVFREDEATDLGDYIGPFVRQRCRMQRQGAWTVFFRPDADGARDEIVVEHGLWPLPAGMSPAHALSPYTATIRRGDTVLATVTVPKHWWFARWRWQSAPRPIRRTLADLVAMKALPPMDARTLYNNPAMLTQVHAWTAPMGTGGLATPMGNAGDRPDIGPITDYQGCYLLRGNAEAETTMRSQAEATGSMPIWVRDARTDNLLDVFDSPSMGLIYTSDATKKIPIPANPTDASFFRMDLGHYPATAFVPWLLTDDPYFLEGAQVSANYSVIESNFHQLNQKLPGLVSPGQKRAWGWGMRNVLQMAAFAPESPPGWLKPRSYFRRMADDNLTYVQRNMASTIKACRIFHMVGLNTTIDSWMEGFCLAVFGWAKWTRQFPEWDAAIDWMAETLLQFTSDPALDRWDRRWPAPYRVPLNRMRTIAVNPSTPAVHVNYNASPEPYASETPDSWRELWTLFQQWMASQDLALTIGPDDRIYEQRVDNPGNRSPSSPHYTEIVRGAMAALALGGVPGARERHDWLHSKLPALYGSYGSGSRAKFKYGIWPG